MANQQDSLLIEIFKIQNRTISGRIFFYKRVEIKTKCLDCIRGQSFYLLSIPVWFIFKNFKGTRGRHVAGIISKPGILIKNNNNLFYFCLLKRFYFNSINPDDMNIVQYISPVFINRFPPSWLSSVHCGD